MAGKTKTKAKSKKAKPRTRAGYADGFVIPIPKKNIAAYRRMAQAAGEVWRDHGCIDYYECVGDDLEVSMDPSANARKMPLFPLLAKAKRGETVLFSWITYKSRAHRDRVNAKVMKDPRMAKMMPKKPPFDFTRMTWGGFEVIVAG